MAKIEQLQAAHAACPAGDWLYSETFSAVVRIDQYKIKAVADFGKIDESKPTGEFVALVHNMMPQILEALAIVQAVAYGNTEFEVLETRANDILDAIGGEPK